MAIQSSINQLIGSAGSLAATIGNLNPEEQQSLENVQMDTSSDEAMAQKAKDHLADKIKAKVNQRIEFEKLKGSYDALSEQNKLLESRLKGYENQKRLRQAKHLANQQRRVNPYGQK